MNLKMELDAFKHAVSKALDFADGKAYVDEQEAKFKEAIAESHAHLDERIAKHEEAVQQLLGHPAVSVPPIELTTKAADPPPQDDAFVAVGATRFSDGQVQTEESLAAASEAWTAAQPLV